MTQETNKSCKVCGELIKIEASKCIHCDSFLDWRKYLNLSSSVISLLIALISVIALSSQQIKDLFDQGHSNVKLAVINSSEGLISLIAVNDGNRSGAISPAELDVYDSRYGNHPYTMIPRDKSFIVEHGKAKQIDLEFKEKNTDAQHKKWIEDGIKVNKLDPKKDFETDCTLDINIIQHDKFLQFFDAQKNQIKKGNIKNKDDSEELPISPPETETIRLNVRCESIFPWLFHTSPSP